MWSKSVAQSVTGGWYPVMASLQDVDGVFGAVRDGEAHLVDLFGRHVAVTAFGREPQVVEDENVGCQRGAAVVSLAALRVDSHLHLGSSLIGGAGSGRALGRREL